jgi:hypothetical protein
VYVAATAIAYGSGPAFAMPPSLVRDLGVTGMVRVCQYSDRNLYTVESDRRCPVQIADPGSEARLAPATIGHCLGYGGPGGPCSTGPGGGLSAEPAGGLSTGPGGGLSAGPGGGLSTGSGGGMNSGPGGGLSTGPGGGLSTAPGGGLYPGPRTGQEGEYKGPWGPCITGAATIEWLRWNCPNRR